MFMDGFIDKPPAFPFVKLSQKVKGVKCSMRIIPPKEGTCALYS
jgi:hypothetical protein